MDRLNMIAINELFNRTDILEHELMQTQKKLRKHKMYSAFTIGCICYVLAHSKIIVVKEDTKEK